MDPILGGFDFGGILVDITQPIDNSGSDSTMVQRQGAWFEDRNLLQSSLDRRVGIIWDLGYYCSRSKRGAISCRSIHA